MSAVFVGECKSTEPLRASAKFYVKRLEFGCAVHAKRTKPETVNTSGDSSLYHCIVGTRKLLNSNDVQRLLFQMKR